MIIQSRHDKVSITEDEIGARYGGARSLVLDVPGARHVVSKGGLRTLVEVFRPQGGMTPRALLGAEFTPSNSSGLHCEVLVADEPLGFGRPATCPSSLGKPLVAGLPDEFSLAVQQSLSVEMQAPACPAGVLRIDRAAYDEVNSSERIFGLTAKLLFQVLLALVHDRDVRPVAAAALSDWGRPPAGQ